MIITNSNRVPLATITGTSPDSMMDSLKSTTGAGLWVPETPDPQLTFTFDAPKEITYIAGVGQHGFSKVTITLDTGDSIIVPLIYHGCFFVHFETTKTVTSFTLTFEGIGTMMNVSAGTSFYVPNGGEQGGYNRAWMQRPFKHEAVINDSALPVSITARAQSIKTKLSVKNMPVSFAQSEWLGFMYFAQYSAFYVCEDESNYQSCYLGFEPKFNGPQAHQATRQLVKADVTFKTYTGAVK